MHTEVADDAPQALDTEPLVSDPQSVRNALKVVAHHGYLTLQNLAALELEEWEAIQRWMREFRPDVFVQLADAYAVGDRVGLYYAKTRLCGLLNLLFDEEATRNLRALPDEERERVRALPVNPETWRQLHARSRRHMAQQHQYRRPAATAKLRPRARRGRRVQRRRVASSPRRARAPGRLGDDEPNDEPPPVALVRGFTAASERLSRHVQPRASTRWA